MQSSGTLTDLSLEGILEAVQKDRATGTLHLRATDGEATLYFLFGHLFHATDAGDEQGEPVVHRALGWSSGDFSFDAKAKLPAEETIKVSTAELLANRPTSSSNGSEPHGDEAAATAQAPVEATPAEPEVAAEAEPEAVAPVEPARPSVAPAPVATGSGSGDPGQRRRRTDKRPGTRPPESMVLYPVPMGQSLHLGLTAGFVDFPKLLRSLAKDGHSGYVKLKGDGFLGILLFSSGAVVEAVYDGDSGVNTGNAAFSHFGDRIDSGDGVLDVIQLSAEMVTGIYQLLTAPSIHERLLARFIKADALLEYLGEERTSGAVIVRGSAGSTGIVLYRDGEILGAYTDGSPEPTQDTAKVVELCSDPAAEIEVRGGAVPDTLPVMDPEEAGPTEVPSTTRGRAGAARASAPVTETPAVVEAPPPAAEPEPTQAEPAADAAEEAEEAEEAAGANWAEAVSEMAGRADTVLGTRSKKVKELLFSSRQTHEDIDATIQKISELSIMFVDPSKLSSLADEFRQIAARQG